MLRNRSRTVVWKQSLWADHHRSSQTPPAQNHSRSRVSSLLGSAFGGLSPSRFCSDGSKPMMSPVLNFDVSPFSGLRTRVPNRFPGAKKRSWEDPECPGVGLAIVDKLFDPDRNHAKPKRNLVLYASSMRLRIPPYPALALEPLESPTDFGIKTRNSQFPSPISQPRRSNSPRHLTECIPVSEIELSEDYTRVTYHGTNARTTHIFDDCVVESYYTLLPNKPKAGQPSFLSFCCTCRKSLEQTKDIYMYRGEKSFCSPECRHQEIMLDGVEDLEAV